MTTNKSASRKPARLELAVAPGDPKWWSQPGAVSSEEFPEQNFCPAAPTPPVRGLDWSRRQPAPGETVLVVDDDSLMRDFLVEILRDAGYHVLEASSAREAQQLTLTHAHISLLLTDYSMPGTNGLELARWFQGHYPEAKVLIATGALWELVNQIGEQEHLAVLPKPFDVAQLHRMMRLVLA